MKTAYFDCISGASGDMILGALLDAGLPLEALQAGLDQLNLEGFQIGAYKVQKNGFSATKFEVQVAQDVPERHLPQILGMVENSQLPAHIIQKAVAIFQRLAQVEACIHNASLEQVHLHELGGIDTIVDVTGALIGIDYLGIQQVVVSPLPLGRGFVRGAHGQIPLPAPATLELLIGVPVVGSEIEKELVTPTGAILLTSLASSYGAIPAMRLESVGYGAGGRDLPIPNLLRVLIGESVLPGSVEATGSATTDGCTSAVAVETLFLLETNLDDLNPEFYDHVLTRLLATGALDVTLAPIQMKKNRPATQLAVLCRPAQVEALEGILFAETSTLGVRRQVVERHALQRELRAIQTPYGEVQVKLAFWGRDQARVAPEYEDCRRLAAEQGVPIQEVYQAALTAARTEPEG